MTQAQYVAVVPVLGLGLARAVQPGRGPWFDYITAHAQETSAQHVRIFPLLLANSAALDNTTLDRILGKYQRLNGSLPATGDRPDTGWRRDLAQGLAQFAGRSGSLLCVFISHTGRRLVTAQAFPNSPSWYER